MLPAAQRKDLGVSGSPMGSLRTLGQIVLDSPDGDHLQNELSLLAFAAAFLERIAGITDRRTITPTDVFMLETPDDWRVAGNLRIRLRRSRREVTDSLYAPPSWCPAEELWRFRLGYLLRFILTAKEDFTQVVRPISWKERSGQQYRVPDGHWQTRRYGMYSAHPAFGNEWLPISSWVEDLLFDLLRWPGIPATPDSIVTRDLSDVIEAIRDRIRRVTARQGAARSVLLLHQPIRRASDSAEVRGLRAAIVQTVIPDSRFFDFEKPETLDLSDPNVRIVHRNHLTAALAAVRQMLHLRESHGSGGELDWLILPELAVHPDDVDSQLVPFARQHKTIILTGITYERFLRSQKYVNSAMWIIPEHSASRGLQIRKLRQGKQHPAQSELTHVVGHRPVQWILGYPWSRIDLGDPLRLTASVCYDATDLMLASDLREQSDVYAIPALNRDVPTYDYLAGALNYHMYQMVVVANNGRFGGSSAYAPYRETWERQIFHLHGQPQASIAFLEVKAPLSSYLQRRVSGKLPVDPKATSDHAFKYPPARM